MATRGFLIGTIFDTAISLLFSQTFTRTGTAVDREALEFATDVKRIEPLKQSPVAWKDLNQYLLPAITDNSDMTYANVQTEIGDWETNYPSDVTVTNMGTLGTEEQSIVTLFDDGTKPILGISCGIHGNEIQSLRGWFAAIDWLLTSSTDLAVSVRSQLTIYFVPLFNPNGTTADQRNNLNGVNLNRNWPYFFSSALDADKGASALSETECSQFVTFMEAGAPSRDGRVLAWVDVHAWSSKDTFGFLTEQINHSHDNILFNRSAQNHIDALMSLQSYTAVNPPVALTEYRSKRKPYLYTWIANRGRPDVWGGIIEYPEAEANTLNASAAQDAMMGLCMASLQQLATPVDGTVSESRTHNGTLPNTSNNNPNLTAWHATEPRPQWFTFQKVNLTQVSDTDLGRNVVEMERPGHGTLAAEQSQSAYAVNVPDSITGLPELYIIGGETAGGGRTTDVNYVDSSDGSVGAAAAFPISARYMAAVHDGTNVYVSGGFSTVYEDAIYKSASSGTSITFSSWLTSMSVYDTGVQRHSMDFWSTNSYLIISGGRDAAGYLDGVFAVDESTGYIWRIATMTGNRGYHTSAVTSGGVLYVFGGTSTGSNTLGTVEKVTLVDNKKGDDTDGVTSGTNFSSTGYTFEAGDAGGTITIQEGSVPGEYAISAFVDVDNVTLSTSPGDASSLAFVVSSAEATMATTTALPASRRRQTASFESGLAYLFGGESAGFKSDLYVYDTSDDSVTTVTYTMDEQVDEESGDLVPVEEPILAAAASYYNPSADTFNIFGGEDELGDARSDIYEISLDTQISGQWGVELNEYGWLRMSQVFTDVTNPGSSMIVAAVKNITGINDDLASYVRININVGPLSAVTRKVRTWYQVASQDEYDMLMMPFELEAGETEFRVYIRHYTAGTIVRVASFQLFASEEVLQYPLAIDELKEPDSNRLTVTSTAPLDTNSRYIIEGDMSPLVNTNVTVDEVDLLRFYSPTDELLFYLSFSSIVGADRWTLGSGTLTVTDDINKSFEDKTSFEINFNRGSGKEPRYDVITWRIDKSGPTASLKLFFYGETLSFSLASIPTDRSIGYVLADNGIYSELRQPSL